MRVTLHLRSLLTVALFYCTGSHGQDAGVQPTLNVYPWLMNDEISDLSHENQLKEDVPILRPHIVYSCTGGDNLPDFDHNEYEKRELVLINTKYVHYTLSLLNELNTKPRSGAFYFGLQQPVTLKKLTNISTVVNILTVITKAATPFGLHTNVQPDIFTVQQPDNKSGECIDYATGNGVTFAQLISNSSYAVSVSATSSNHGLRFANSSTSSISRHLLRLTKNEPLNYLLYDIWNNYSVLDRLNDMKPVRLGISQSPAHLMTTPGKHNTIPAAVFNYPKPVNFNSSHTGIFGDTIIIAKADINAFNDLASLILTKDKGISLKRNPYTDNRAFITIDSGIVDKNGWDTLIEKDIGLALLNNMINAKDKNGMCEVYLYSTANKITVSVKATDSLAGIYDECKWLKRFGKGIDNISITPRNMNGGIGKDDKVRPPQGLCGMVRISMAGKFVQRIDGELRPVNRPSIVFHELYENFQRTHYFQPYERKDKSGAHKNAIDAEGTRNYDNDNPGIAYFLPNKKAKKLNKQ